MAPDCPSPRRTYRELSGVIGSYRDQKRIFGAWSSAALCPLRFSASSAVLSVRIAQFEQNFLCVRKMQFSAYSEYSAVAFLGSSSAAFHLCDLCDLSRPFPVLVAAFRAVTSALNSACFRTNPDYSGPIRTFPNPKSHCHRTIIAPTSLRASHQKCPKSHLIAPNRTSFFPGASRPALGQDSPSQYPCPVEKARDSSSHSRFETRAIITLLSGIR